MVKREKRNRPRVDFNIETVFETENQVHRSDRCENISMSGIFLRTEDPLPVGTTGRITITLTCGESRLEIKGECRVVRQEAAGGEEMAGMGLEFTDIDSDSSINLFNVVKYQGGLNDG